MSFVTVPLTISSADVRAEVQFTITARGSQAYGHPNDPDTWAPEFTIDEVQLISTQGEVLDTPAWLVAAVEDEISNHIIEYCVLSGEGY